MSPGSGPSSSNTTGATLDVTVDARRFIRTIFYALLGWELLLVLLDATVNYGQWVGSRPIQRLFNMAREDSLANWFASVQELSVGLVLWLVFLTSRREGEWKALLWAGVAAFFTYMAIDDGAAIHERIGSAAKDAGVGGFYSSYRWQVVLGPLFGAVGFVILVFVRRELRETRLREWLLIGLGCYASKVGLDYIEGLPGGYHIIADMFTLGPLAVRHFGMVFEEFLKMVGTTFFLTCFLTHLTHISPRCSIEFKQGQDQE